MRNSFTNFRLSLPAAVLLLGIFACVLCQHNSIAHVRFILLSHGHLFCELKSPRQIPASVQPAPHTFVSNYAYDHKTYLGYFGTFGEFHPAGTSVQEWPLDAFLYFSKDIFLAALCLIALICLLRQRQNKTPVGTA